LAGGGFSACGPGSTWSFAFDLLGVSNEDGGGALLALSTAAGAELSAAIPATAGGEITAFFSASGRGCA